MIKGEGLHMLPYLLSLILVVGVLFLLYCLWNFGRELRPRRSTSAFSIASARRTRPAAIPVARFRTRAQIAQLGEHSRAAS
jgi:hypothetical protein